MWPFTWALCPSYILYLVLCVAFYVGLLSILYTLVLYVTFYVGPLSILYILVSLTCDLLRGPFVHPIYFI